MLCKGRKSNRLAKFQEKNLLRGAKALSGTGKSLSEALIFELPNPQYDNRLFIELQVQYMKVQRLEHGKNMLCTEIVSDMQNNFCTQLVLPMFCKK